MLGGLMWRRCELEDDVDKVEPSWYISGTAMQATPYTGASWPGI